MAIINNIEHTSYRLVESTASVGYYYIYVTADLGYKFNTSDMPTYHYIADSGNEYTRGFIVYPYGQTREASTGNQSGGARQSLTPSVYTERDVTLIGSVIVDTAQLTITNNIVNSTADYAGSGNVYTFTVTPDSGYKFEVAPAVRYYSRINGTFQTSTMEISADGKLATIEIVGVGDTYAVTFSGVVVEDVEQITVVNNIDNAAFSTETVSSGNYVITITANSGYIFSTAPTIIFTDNSGVEQTVTADVSGDKQSAAADVNNVNVAHSVVLNGDVVISEITVTNNVSNTTETHVYSNNTAVITLTTNSGYIINSADATYYDNSGSIQTAAMVVGSSGSTATVTITEFDASQLIVLSGVTVNVITVHNNLTNYTAQTEIPQHYLPNSVMDITIYPTVGNEFDAAQSVIDMTYYNSSGLVQVIAFTIADDKQSATIYVDLSTLDINTATGIYLRGGSVPITTITEFGSINVYVVTMDNLSAFGNKRFFYEQIGESTVEYVDIDLGKYVNRIKRVHTDITVGGSDTIKCGNYDTEIEVTVPTESTLTVDFGNVAIPQHNNDLTDYEGEVQIYLPFVGFVDIPSDYSGETLQLQYIINIVTGNGVAIISHNGVMVQQHDCRPSSNIIYTTPYNDNSRTIGSDDFDAFSLLNLEPFVRVKYFVSANSGERNSDNIRAVLGDIRGYFVASDITPLQSDTMLVTEREMILEQLNNGVTVE